MRILSELTRSTEGLREETTFEWSDSRTLTRAVQSSSGDARRAETKSIAQTFLRIDVHNRIKPRRPKAVG